jgi:uncharacterized protein YjdB
MALDDTVIKRHEDGTIEALAEGIAEVTARSVDGGYTATCVVTVKPYIESESIILDEQELTLYVGDFYTLSAIVYPEDATDQALNWTSSNTDVALVDEHGVIEAIGYGTTTITVSCAANSTIDASCEVVVYEHCTGVELSAANIELYEGETFELIAHTLPFATTDGLIEWSVSDESIVTCDNGIITALKQGYAEVIATSLDGGYTAICEITVIKENGAVENTTCDENMTYKIYNLQGMPLEKLQKGVNIVIYENGTTKKVMIK